MKNHKKEIERVLKTASTLRSKKFYMYWCKHIVVWKTLEKTSKTFKVTYLTAWEAHPKWTSGILKAIRQIFMNKRYGIESMRKWGKELRHEK